MSCQRLQIRFANSFLGRLSGHETFPLRQLWLRKAYDAVTETREPAQRSVFAGEDAIVRFGVGKNMAMSIRFWATACGIVDETKEGYVPTGLGHYRTSHRPGRGSSIRVAPPRNHICGPFGSFGLIGTRRL